MMRHLNSMRNVLTLRVITCTSTTMTIRTAENLFKKHPSGKHVTVLTNKLYIVYKLARYKTLGSFSFSAFPGQLAQKKSSIILFSTYEEKFFHFRP